jgi:nucleoid DNA-binding protein
MKPSELLILDEAFKIIERHLKQSGEVVIPQKGVFHLLPRKQGKTFCGFRNKEGTPLFSKRVRFTISKELRKKLC